MIFAVMTPIKDNGLIKEVNIRQEKASSLDEMISSGKMIARQEIQERHFFTATVYLSDDPSLISLNVCGKTIQLPDLLIPANQSKSSAMRLIAERICETDPRCEIAVDGKYLRIRFREDAYIQVLKDHYLVMSTEEILSLCRKKIFVKHSSYIRPYKIDVTKDDIVIAWGDSDNIKTKTVHRFGTSDKPKSLTETYIICYIINEYSGNKYEYSNILSKGKIGEASWLTIKNNSDMYN